MDRKVFEKAYSAWQDAAEKKLAERPPEELFRSDLEAKSERYIIGENPAYHGLVALGVPALPYILERFFCPTQRFDADLTSAVADITKWRIEGIRAAGLYKRVEWKLEDFSELPQCTLPQMPSATDYWRFWWTMGRFETPGVFERLYGEYAGAKAGGDDAAVKDRLRRMRNLGIAAFPKLMEKLDDANAGDLIPIASYWSDGAFAADAPPEAARDWWAQNKRNIEWISDKSLPQPEVNLEPLAGKREE